MKNLLIILISLLLLSSFLTSCEKKDGFGTETFDDGSKYEGEWKDGKRLGQGTFTFPDGGKYVGEFKGGLKNGQGTLTFHDVDEYVGKFSDEKFHGQGTYFFTKGQKFVGEYKDGDWWNGTLYDKNENIMGKYVNGKEIKE